ncbi:Slam-dependent surface lipoprotein [Phocoenobacter skyensis]|uniref:Slam-dependent surface lipoprotein n=1 Tax=Phocoenobacter skyensis TaxID=97481 RepID=UPI00276A38C2|nr:Slam-dependent surface lipoprotein [Pasteurella skyensis]MDP8186014.1 Slam-dependent surface lipoprotein [Pasteurella skyensis]
MQKATFAVMALTSLFAATTASATVTSGISNGGAALKLPVQGSTFHNGWFHQDPGGLPGIEIEGVTSKVSSFSSLKNVAKKVQWMKTFGGVDSNGVVVLKMSNMPDWVPGFHNKLGDFAYKQVGSQELYFGEWVAKDANPNTARVVYYAGNNKTQIMPTNGVAVYSVKGINQNSELNKALLNGEFTANFNTGNLTGTIAKTGLTVGVDARINANASFEGSATANGANGSTNGHFFGSDASALAGCAKFENNQYDTAFGGTKK